MDYFGKYAFNTIIHTSFSQGCVEKQMYIVKNPWFYDIFAFVTTYTESTKNEWGILNGEMVHFVETVILL